MTIPAPKPQSDTDIIDRLISEWRTELPKLDPSAMSIVGRIMRLGALFEAEAEAGLKPFGLRYTDFDILATLRRSGPPYCLPPSRLCELVVLSSGAMTTALDRLERSQMIVRIADKSDRRIKAAQLTTTGRKTAHAAAEARFKIAEVEVKSLSPTEIETFVHLLRKLARQ